jgi:hypothetical protein
VVCFEWERAATSSGKRIDYIELESRRRGSFASLETTLKAPIVRILIHTKTILDW